MGISLDCHGHSPRNDAEIATSRADSRNDVAGILLPTRIVVGRDGKRAGIKNNTRIVGEEAVVARAINREASSRGATPPVIPRSVATWGSH